jgi:hypothetical protein
MRAGDRWRRDRGWLVCAVRRLIVVIVVFVAVFVAVIADWRLATPNQS